MAGNDYRKRISSIRCANRTYCFRATYALRDIAVGHRLSVGNTQQFFEDTDLKIGTREVQRQVEFLARASKVLEQLLRGRCQLIFIENPVGLGITAHRPFRKSDHVQSLVITGQ